MAILLWEIMLLKKIVGPVQVAAELNETIDS